MKPMFLKVLEFAIDEGVSYGITRFWKHRDDEPPTGLEEALSGHVMSAIHEWFEVEQ